MRHGKGILAETPPKRRRCVMAAHGLMRQARKDSMSDRYSGIAKGYHQRCAFACLLAGEIARPFVAYLHPNLIKGWKGGYANSWKHFLERIEKAGLEHEIVTDKKGYYIGIRLVGFKSISLQAMFYEWTRSTDERQRKYTNRARTESRTRGSKGITEESE